MRYKTIKELGVSKYAWKPDGKFVETAFGTPIAEMIGKGETVDADQKIICAVKEFYAACLLFDEWFDKFTDKYEVPKELNDLQLNARIVAHHGFVKAGGVVK